jgi:hypothetical protein
MLSRLPDTMTPETRATTSLPGDPNSFSHIGDDLAVTTHA